MSSGRRAVFTRGRLATLEVVDADNDVTLGSAFAVHQKHGPGIIVSAAHVLRPTDDPPPTHFRFFVVDSDPVTSDWGAHSMLLRIDPSNVVVHEQHDLAAVQYPNTQFPDSQALELAIQSAPEVGDQVATFGWPATTPDLLDREIIVAPTACAGIVSDIFPHPEMPLYTHAFYLVQLPLHPGNSGGPIFDLRTGGVVGVVSQRLAQQVVGVVDDRLADSIMIRHGLTSAVPIHHFDSLDFPRQRRTE